MSMQEGASRGVVEQSCVGYGAGGRWWTAPPRPSCKMLHVLEMRMQACAAYGAVLHKPGRWGHENPAGPGAACMWVGHKGVQGLCVML